MKKFSSLILAIFLLTSCSQDTVEKNAGDNGKEVTAHFSLSTLPMVQKVLGDASKATTTRSTPASGVTDTQITDMWVVQFDAATGNFIKKSYVASANPAAFDVQLQGNATGTTSNLYFLANMGSILASPNAGEATFKTQIRSIAQESDLFIAGAVGKSIPMYGVLTGVTVPSTGYIASMSVTLTRMLAQVSFTYTVDPSITSTFVVEKIRVCNVPAGIGFYPPATATTTPTVNAGVAAAGYINLPYETAGASSSTVNFYLPENQQGIGTNTTGSSERLKIGVPNATYIEIVGHTIGSTQCGDEIHHRIYLGADTYNNYNVVRNTQYTMTSTLKGYSLSDKRVSINERSNCYVLQTVDPTTNPLGQVNIPIRHANDSDLGTQIADVRTITASQISTSWQTAISTNNMLTYDTSNLAKGYFTVKYNYASFATTPGDAVVALKDASGNILWTWHIWMVTPANDPTLPANQLVANGNTWMKFNLGACNLPGTGPNWASLTGGLQYQWGRKDPFPCSDNIGSGVVGGAISNYTLPTFSSPSLTVIPIGEGAVRWYDVSANYTNALLCSVRYPLLFMNKWSGGTATAAADAGGIVGADSWGGNYGQPKNIAYDPCPEGYRVPSFFKTSSTATSPWAGMAWNYVTSGGTSSCYGTDTSASAYGAYGICGGRDANYGKFYTVGSNGNYWSASVTGTAGFSFLLTTADVTPASSSSRASGYNVRCVKSW